MSRLLIAETGTRSTIPARTRRGTCCARKTRRARYREPLDVAQLARAARLSQAHFSREFRRAFGETPHPVPS